MFRAVLPRGAPSRRALRAAGLASACALVAAIAPVAAVASTQAGDHAEIAELEQKIATEGITVQSLVQRYDTVAGQLNKINTKMAADRKRLALDQHATAQATTHLREVAIAAYVNAQFGSSSGVAAYGAASASALQEKNIYLGTVNGSLDSATAELENDEEDVTATERSLKVEQAATVATLRAVATTKSAAQSAIALDQHTLNQVQGNLLGLVTAAAARRAAAEARQQEQAIAATTAQRASESATDVSSVVANPSPGSYSNPLRAVRGLVPERIDQGVDYDGFGPIYAIGDGTVVSTVNGGWPAGTFITYRLSDGPAAGLTVYAAEDIEPTVSVGEHVTARTQIGTVYEGSTGIETGWADPAGDGATMAADNDEYYGSNSTAFGLNFSQLLSSLGAPGGILQGGVSGAVPAAWPTW